MSYKRIPRRTRMNRTLWKTQKGTWIKDRSNTLLGVIEIGRKDERKLDLIVKKPN